MEFGGVLRGFKKEVEEWGRKEWEAAIVLLSQGVGNETRDLFVLVGNEIRGVS